KKHQIGVGGANALGQRPVVGCFGIDAVGTTGQGQPDLLGLLHKDECDPVAVQLGIVEDVDALRAGLLRPVGGGDALQIVGGDDASVVALAALVELVGLVGLALSWLRQPGVAVGGRDHGQVSLA